MLLLIYIGDSEICALFYSQAYVLALNISSRVKIYQHTTQELENSKKGIIEQ